jgi:hypothetical protein
MNGRRTLAAFVAIAALATGLGACGGDDDDGGEKTKTSDEEGFEVTFAYPGDFDLSTDIEAGATAGEEAGERAGVALDDQNGIFIVKTGLNIPVTEQNLARARPQIDALVTQIAGRPVQGEESEVGGLPALGYPPFTYEEAGLTSRLIVIFDQAVEYQLNCQWDDEHMAEVQAACDQALSTLEPRSG